MVVTPMIEKGLTALAEAVERDDENKMDVVLPLRGVKPVPKLSAWEGHGALELYGTKAGDRLYLGQRSSSQLCGLLGIPTTYWRRCSPKLKMEQIQYWLEERERTVLQERGTTNDESGMLMWRCREQGSGGLYARAVVSPRYAKFNNVDMLGVIADLEVPLLADPFRVVGFDLDDASLVVRVLPDGVEGEGGNGKYGASLILANSEVGASAVRVRAGLYRMICNNGLWGWDDYGNAARRHLGEPADIAAWVEGVVPTMAKVAASGAAMVVELDTWLSLPGVELHWLIGFLGEQVELSGEQMATWLWYKLNGYPDFTKRAWVDALTAAAREFSGLERLGMEGAAGQVARYLLSDANVLDEVLKWHERRDRELKLPEIETPEYAAVI